VDENLELTKAALFDNVVNVGIVAAGASYGAIIIPFLLIALYLLQHFYLRTSRQMRHLDLEAKSPLYTQFSEIAAGILHIRAFSWQSHVLAQSFRLLDTSQKPYYYMFCVQRWLTMVLELCVKAVAVILVIMALNLPHATSEGAIGLALLNLISFGSGMANLINAWTRLETSVGAVSRLRSFLSETPPEPIPQVGCVLPMGWPQYGRIEVSRLSADYGYESTAPDILLI
jgi:ABC-type multidrug transport system fused ATPase/permease subunit